MDVQCGDCGAHFALDPAGSVTNAACSECGGKRFFRSQPSPTESDGTLRDTPEPGQPDPGGNPLGEGTIVGDDHEQPAYKRDNFMHSKTSEAPNMLYEQTDIPPGMTIDQYNRPPSYTTSPRVDRCPICGAHVDDPLGYNNHIYTMHPEMMQVRNASTPPSEQVETMRSATLNMDPYPFLWGPQDEFVKTAGPLALLPLVGEGLAAGGEAAGAGAAAGEAAGIGAGDAAAAGGLGGLVKKALPTVMKHVLGIGDGAQSGSMAPQAPTPAPQMEALGHTDIPMLLTAATPLETPHSVKNIPTHDDPEKIDTKEFNDQDHNPNFENPNLEDSGADGEDAVRDHAGFGDDSPGVDRAMMILPLLLHFAESPESGQSDPLVRALHDALDQENPGYLQQEHPEGEQLMQALIQHHKQPKQAGVNMTPAMPGGLPSMPMPQGLGQNPGGGTCPNCGGVLAGDGSCPQCGAKQHPQGGSQMPAPGGNVNNGMSMPPNMARVANSQGPVTPEQIAAVQQLLLGKAGKEQNPEQKQAWLDMIPDVPLNPANYAKYMAEIQQQPNVAPPVDPSQIAPPPGQMNPPGAMPMPDPTQPGMSGQPMQPMARIAADNIAPRCPYCGSGTTGLRPGSAEDKTSAECHSCHRLWDVGGKIDMHKYESAVILADMVNPILAPAAEQHHRHDRVQDSSLTWQDTNGEQLQEGQIYSMHTPAYPVPDEVEVLYANPDELGLKLVGQISNLSPDPTDQTPDIRVDPHQLRMQGYTFTPSQQGGGNEQPLGGTPGLEQIPQSGQTTDEQQASYPNPGTVSQVLASEEIDDDNEICHKCGGNWIEHIASSPVTQMHECARCGSVWETRDEFEGREASVDLNWIMQDANPYGDDFFNEMERHKAMASAGGRSRDLAAAVAKDSRYERVRELLNQNKMTREAGRHFTPSEQRSLINERGTARNADLLDLSNTHYETRYDYSGKANGMNVPDEHLLFGVPD